MSDSITTNELLFNAMQSRTDLIRKMLDHNGSRDINKECGYPDDITPEEYGRLFDREGISTRVVELFPKECWKDAPEVIEGEKAKDTPFEKSWKALVTRHKLYAQLQRVDILSGIGRFGVLLLGFDDNPDMSAPVNLITKDRKASEASITPSETQDPLASADTSKPDRTPGTVLKIAPVLAPADTPAGDALAKGDQIAAAPTEPASKTPRKTKLLWVRAVEERYVSIEAYEIDTANPRYGQPTFYKIIIQNEKGASTTSKTLRVHWTRVIHVADNRLSSEIYGTPRMQTVYNRLYDLRKVLGGAGEMFWKGGFPGYSFEVNPDAENSIDFDASAMREEFQKYSNGLQRYMAVVGVTAKSLAPQVADPTNHVEMYLKVIALCLGVPYRIFIGTEEAQLAGNQDAKAWNSRIGNRREQYVTPYIIQPLVTRLIEAGVVEAPSEYDQDTETWIYSVKWPKLQMLSEQEKAELAAKLTEAIAKYIGANAEGLIPPEEFLLHILGMEQDVVTRIIEATRDFEDLTIPTPEEVAAAAAMAGGANGGPVTPPGTAPSPADKLAGKGRAMPDKKQTVPPAVQESLKAQAKAFRSAAR